MTEPLATENLLGAYLRDRRMKLDPAVFGFSVERRRTSGLRREEVAQRANISPTWYTWLEQGRGGAPSADVLDRIARALMLTDVEREHLFLLGLGRPPEVRYQKNEGVTPRLQRVLDALDPSPALIRTAIWDVVAWNRAATVMLMDYGSLPPEKRNILRFIFLDRRARAAQYDWESVARFVVASFQDRRRAGRGCGRGGAARRRTLPAQSRIQDDVARERRSRPARQSRQAHTPSASRPARFRIFGLRGRWPDGPQHGGLQSGDAGRR
jgi:transcriptional regulator with XRE-family HTH domain